MPLKMADIHYEFVYRRIPVRNPVTDKLASRILRDGTHIMRLRYDHSIYIPVREGSEVYKGDSDVVLGTRPLKIVIFGQPVLRHSFRRSWRTPSWPPR